MKKIVGKTTLYNQLFDLLKEEIENNLEPNSSMPSERVLSEKYGLSRTTVRLALQELERIGYIYRRHGKGTFVSGLSKEPTDLSGSYSFTEQMRQMKKNPQTKTMEFEIIEASSYFAEHLNVNIGDKLIKLKRLRLADGLPMMVERSYLPFKQFMTMTRFDVELKPLYDIFSEDFNEDIKFAEEEFYASIANKKDARLLDILEGSPVLNLIRTTYNHKNEIIEFTLSVARADQFRYKIRHVKNMNR